MKWARIMFVVASLQSLVSCDEQSNKAEVSDQPPSSYHSGYLSIGHESRSFAPCGDKPIAYWIKGVGGNIRSQYQRLTHGVPFLMLYAELEGSIDITSRREGFAEQYDGIFSIERARKIEPLAKENDCDGYLKQYYDEEFDGGDVSFRIVSQYGTIHSTAILPLGFTETSSAVFTRSFNRLTHAEVADLNNDGYPEVYAFLGSVESEAGPRVLAVTSVLNQHISTIDITALEKLPTLEHPYQYVGRDQYSINGNRLLRKFPIFREGGVGVESVPTQEVKTIQYMLVFEDQEWKLRAE